jgi:hypothetical protein
MKYDIQKYLDQARTVYANLANTQDLFCGCNSYWKVGNVFDTMTDFLLVSDDSPGTIAADVYRIYKDLKGACWYDDYAWWGLASSKASDPQYDTIFGASKTDFQNLANETWTFMNKGKGGDPPSTYGAPNVWDTVLSNDTDKAYFMDPKTWAVPRIPGGVWQYEMFKDQRPGDCSYYNPSDPVSPNPDPKHPNDKPCWLGPFQITVVNALYLLLAGRLQALGVPADPDPRDAFEREYSFLNTWFFMYDPGSSFERSLIWEIRNGGGWLFRERVSTYALLPDASEFPKVRAYDENAAWCGDQGLLMAGMDEYYKLHHDDTMRFGMALNLVYGVVAKLTIGGVLQPLTLDIGDPDDYMCGPGVFMRYLLRVFNSNPTLKAWLIDSFVHPNPDSNFIYKSAEDALGIDPKRESDLCRRLFDHFNILSTLTTAYVILGAAN